MDRNSETNTLLLWIIGGVSVICLIVGVIACLFLAVMIFGVNPFGPTIYNLF